ncbi:MAG: leucine-rich repeat domain-containing protein [Acetatifactor sp.]|nr:leucine-rich repeat domain-containing protein [Acetatifactor sp.]
MKKIQAWLSWMAKHLWSVAALAMLFVLVLCPMQAKASSGELTPELLRERLEALKIQYQDGKYWNHVGSDELNLEGTTDTPCPFHNGHGSTCNYFTYEGTQYHACSGFASILSMKLYGQHYTERNTSSNLDELQPGDVILYGMLRMQPGHVVTVLGVHGSTIRVVDCNGDYHCIIKWGREYGMSYINERLNLGLYGGRGNVIFKAPIPIAYKDGYCGENATYELGDDGTLTISGTGWVDNHFFENNEAIRKIVIEDGITGVGLLAFGNCPNLEEVVFADSVESIYDKCFYGCGALAESNVPAKLSYLGNEAFRDTMITEFLLPDGIRTVGSNIFRGCPGFCGNACHYTLEDGNLRIWGSGSVYDLFFSSNTDIRKVIFEEGITGIGRRTFASCTALEEVEFAGSMETIGEEAFCSSSALAKTNETPNLKKIGPKAFMNTSLTEFAIPEGVESVGAEAFRNCPGYCGNYARYTLEDGILRITGTGDVYDDFVTKSPYVNASSIREIYVGEGIMLIGATAFSNCNNLIYASLPSTVTSVYFNAFYECQKLANVDCYASPFQFSYPKVAYTNINTSFITYPEKTTLFHVPEGSVEYWQILFEDQMSVTFVGDLPDGGLLSEIVETGYCGNAESQVFYTLWTDGTLIIEGMGELGREACSTEVNPNFRIIKNITIKEGISSIPTDTFKGCDLLKTITIPQTISAIGTPFDGCTSLTDVYCHADVRYAWAMLDSGQDYSFPENITIHVREEDLEAWESLKGIAPEGAFAGDLTAEAEPLDLTQGRCGVDAYYEVDENGCLRIYGEGKIYDNFFSKTWEYENYTKKVSFHQLNLKKIVIEEGITEIGKSEFAWLGVTEAMLPDSLETIGADAFSNCKSLKSVTIPDGVESIGLEAFEKCESLSTITLPHGLKELGTDVFYGCTKITELQCLANPRELTWGTADIDFIVSWSGKQTICHVPSNYLKGYKEKFDSKVNAIFKGDLAPNMEGITLEAVEALEETCTADGNIAFYLGSDEQIYVTQEGALLTDQNGDGVVDLLDVILPAGHIHTEDSLIWRWEKAGEDFAVTACLKCMRCGTFEESVSATVTKTDGEGGVTYVATATVGDTEVSMTREIKNEYYVTLDGTSSTHAYGDRVQAFAAAPSEGMAFAGWYEGETLVCTSTDIDFLVYRNIALHTVYVDAAQYVEPAEPILNFDLSERVFDENGNQKLDMTVTWYLSNGMSVKDVGLVRTTDEEAELSIDNEEVKKRSAGVDNTSGTFIHHLTLGEISGALTAYAKAYLVYDDAQGEEHVLYTERQSSAPAVRADEAATPLTEGTRSDAPTEAAESADDNAPAAETESSDDNAPAAEAEDADDNAPAEET